MKSFNKLSNPNFKLIGMILGIISFFVILQLDFGASSSSIKYMAAISCLTAVWWITEALPLAITSLVPFIMIPLFGIMKSNDIAAEYFNSTIMIYIGGFMVALAMEKWNLHKRISLQLIKIIGTSPSRIILGFMLSSMFISMFISNTATAVMLLPIGLAIILQIEAMFPKSQTSNFSTALMLGIAYAASIGGIATLIGTPPNLVFQKIYTMNFPDAPAITYLRWASFAFPVSLVFIFIAYFVLAKLLFRPSKDLLIDQNFINDEYMKLGKPSFEEKWVAVLFVIISLLWLSRADIDLGFVLIPGWASLLRTGSFVDDGTVAISIGLVFFLIPSKTKDQKLLDVSVIPKIPWDVVLLFGGGFALAKGFAVSGLADFIGNQFQLLGNANPIVMTASINFLMTFLTELTSNTATSNIVLPILASIAKANSINPLILMIPAVISVSFAFMLPVATPPNAIVYGSGRIKIIDMVKAGLILNLIGVVVVTVMFYLLGVLVYGIKF